MISENGILPSTGHGRFLKLAILGNPGYSRSLKNGQIWGKTFNSAKNGPPVGQKWSFLPVFGWD